MNIDESIASFFYNLVPGTLFIIGLEYLSGNKTFFKDNIFNSQELLITIMLGLFFGFIFQGLTKILRSKYLNRRSFSKIVEKDEYLFKTAKEILLREKLINRKLFQEESDESKTKIFYLIDNFLRGDNRANAIGHFTARLAFWSNIFFGCLFLLFVAIYYHKLVEVTVLLLLLFYSEWLFEEYLYILYSSILQTFVAYIYLLNPLHNKE